MDQSKPLKILIASIDAGGGHLELKNSFIRSFADHPEIDPIEYHSPIKSYDQLYRAMVLYAPRLYTIVSRAAKTPGIFTRVMPYYGAPEIKSLTKAILEHQPDMVISTISMVSVMAQYIRRRQHLSYVAVNCQADYGDQHREVHPEDPADFYLVRDEYTKECIQPYLKNSSIFTYGTTVNPVFTNAASLTDQQATAQAQAILSAQPEGRRFDPQKPTILCMGGSGWTRRSQNVISRLAHQGVANVLVICGHDQKFYTYLQTKTQALPLLFVQQPDLAILERQASILLLSSIAPASMNEMMEVNHAPILVHRFIKDQEDGNLATLTKQGAAIFQPDDDRMFETAMNFLAHPETCQPLLAAATAIRQQERTKSAHNADLMIDMMNQYRARHAAQPIIPAIG